MKHISIIWAGAAGLMTAATILEYSENQDIEIHMYEKNLAPGKKILLSWGGRCNITTGNEEKKILETKYTRGWSFIKKSMGKFSPKKVREWFESHGVSVKIESDMRVFPVSDDGKDVVRAFEDIFENYRDKVFLHYGEGVDTVWITPDLWWDPFTITTKKSSHTSDILVITTGGNAYSHTGSSGDGYAFARSLGHTVTELWPSLSSFLTAESWMHELSGISLEHACIRYNEWVQLRWPLLLTHFGISWPLAFMVSSHLAWTDIWKWKTKLIFLSPLENMSEKDWDQFFKDSFQSHPKKILSTILSEKLSRRFAESIVKQHSSHLEHIFVSSISRSERERLASLLGNGIPITLLERKPGDEFVTAWGVSTDELESETMESKLHKNLYFAGEVLNVDGYTGGYSLQICWASGYAVWRAISDN